MVETSLRILDLLQFTTQININCISTVAPHGQHLALRAPFSLVKEGTGLRTGTAPSRHPASIKRVNRVKRGNYYLRVNRRLAEPTITSGLRQIGNHTLSVTMCGGHQRGKGGAISIEAPKLTNPRPLRHHHRLSLFPLFSLCQLSVSSLSL